MDGENRLHYEPNLRKWQKNYFQARVWAPKIFFVNFSSTRCETLLQAIILCNLKENVWSKLKKMVKTLFWVWFRPLVFFFKNFTASVTKYHGQLSSCTISENTNDPILRKFSDGWTDVQIKWWADGHMDRRTRLISYDAIRLTSSVQNPKLYTRKFQSKPTNWHRVFHGNSLFGSESPETQGIIHSVATQNFPKR